jgi:uncharacterized damage-inducible protein DinB
MAISELATAFVRKSSDLLASDYMPRIERSVSHLSEDQIWQRPNEASNSVGNLLLHLRGNVTQWIVGGVGQRPHERRRDEEFAERGPIPSPQLLRQLRLVVNEAGQIIAGLDDAGLLSRRQIQGYDVTVLEAVYHVVEHFGMHTGQIILLAKAYTGADLKLWQPPAP